MPTAGVRVYAAGTGRKGFLVKNLSSSSFPSGLFSLFFFGRARVDVISHSVCHSLFSICQHLYMEEKKSS
jgi:3'-phosphoadenosine 5'-phosphosulfate sulfotransferase